MLTSIHLESEAYKYVKVFARSLPTVSNTQVKSKGKAVPLQAWTDPEDS